MKIEHKIKNYFNSLEDIRKNQPTTALEILSRLKISKSSLYYILKLLESCRQIEKSKRVDGTREYFIKGFISPNDLLKRRIAEILNLCFIKEKNLYVLEHDWKDAERLGIKLKDNDFREHMTIAELIANHRKWNFDPKRLNELMKSVAILVAEPLSSDLKRKFLKALNEMKFADIEHSKSAEIRLCRGLGIDYIENRKLGKDGLGGI